MASGISVILHPEKFEGAIERHGQYLRWYSSMPCHCVDELARVDPGCNKCLGRGQIYYPNVKRRRMELIYSYGGLLINTKYDILSIYRIYSPGNPGEDVEYDSFTDKAITLTESKLKGAFFYIDYEEKLEMDFTGIGTWLGNGLIRVSLPEIETNQGLFNGEISSVVSVTNITKSKSMTVNAFWEDLILTTDFGEAGDEISVVCKYVKPVQFLVNNITQKQKEESFAIYQDADASCSFPGYMTAGSGDIISMLKAEQKQSIVGMYTGGIYYELPVFHVSKLIRVEDDKGEITDVSIVRNNEIMFSGRVPEERFSVSFMYNPTFVMMGELPTLRYGENKVLPKKIALKRFAYRNRQERRPRSTPDFGPGGIS